MLITTTSQGIALQPGGATAGQAARPADFLHSLDTSAGLHESVEPAAYLETIKQHEECQKLLTIPNSTTVESKASTNLSP